jgi:hypothetical protein
MTKSGNLSFKIDYPQKSADWIDCWLTIGETRRHLNASSIFSPFPSLLQFVQAIAGRRLPASFLWEEEGPDANFLATFAEPEGEMVHLRILHSSQKKPWLDADFPRETLIQTFLPPLVAMAQDFQDDKNEWELPRAMVEKVQRRVMEGIPPRSDVYSAQRIDFQIQGDYEGRIHDGHITVTFSLFDQVELRLFLYNTDPFWQDWIGFLEQTAQAAFPARCSQIENHKISDEEIFQWETRFVALPVSVDPNFRLQVFSGRPNEEEKHKLEEVLDRRQFVQDFVQAFERFLREEYQPTPDWEGNTFDLRTLPLEQLKTLFAKSQNE